jgi:AbrB family looped-hinge helix DNA binding protein
MHATIDKAGRLVLPKALRDQVGLRAGEVNVFADGAGLRVEPIAAGALEEREGRLVVASSGLDVNDEMVRALRDGDQR